MIPAKAKLFAVALGVVGVEMVVLQGGTTPFLSHKEHYGAPALTRKGKHMTMPKLDRA